MLLGNYSHQMHAVQHGHHFIRHACHGSKVLKRPKASELCIMAIGHPLALPSC